MNADIPLRSGVVFREAEGRGCIEMPRGKRYEGVRHLGAVPGTTDDGKPAQVEVFSAVYPTTPDRIAKREHIAALAVVGVETQYLAGDRWILPPLFFMSYFIDGGENLDPTRTVVLTMHGAYGVADDALPGRPCVPGPRREQDITLGPEAVATLIGWVRNSTDQPATAVVNLGCFSSTRQNRDSPTFNEDLAGLLAERGPFTIFGPPHEGVVTAATSFARWREVFSQRVAGEVAIQEVRIKFQPITPVARPIENRQARRAARAAAAKAKPTPKPVCHGSVVITNDHALASALCCYSPDFAEVKSHEVDRNLME